MTQDHVSLGVNRISTKAKMSEITPDLFCQIGRTLYRGDWLQSLAAALSISDRAARRMAQGQAPIPDSLRDELARLIEDHGEDLDGLLVRLRGDGK